MYNQKLLAEGFFYTHFENLALKVDLIYSSLQPEAEREEASHVTTSRLGVMTISRTMCDISCHYKYIFWLWQKLNTSYSQMFVHKKLEAHNRVGFLWYSFPLLELIQCSFCVSGHLQVQQLSKVVLCAVRFCVYFFLRFCFVFYHFFGLISFGILLCFVSDNFVLSYSLVSSDRFSSYDVSFVVRFSRVVWVSRVVWSFLLHLMFLMLSDSVVLSKYLVFSDNFALSDPLLWPFQSLNHLQTRFGRTRPWVLLLTESGSRCCSRKAENSTSLSLLVPMERPCHAGTVGAGAAVDS